MQSKLYIFSFIVTTFGVLFKKSSLISKSKIPMFAKSTTYHLLSLITYCNHLLYIKNYYLSVPP